MIRTVLDANVFVSAIISPLGIPAQILKGWRDEQFHLVLSEEILREIGRVFRYPKIAKRHGWSERQVRLFVDDLSNLAILTPGVITLSVIKDDLSDNRFLECAVEGEADYIVSGDENLLSLENFQGTEILTPRAFLEVLTRQSTQ
jgi:putative PIN family toxin of toxin-antitoxin system